MYVVSSAHLVGVDGCYVRKRCVAMADAAFVAGVLLSFFFFAAAARDEMALSLRKINRQQEENKRQLPKALTKIPVNNSYQEGEES